MLAARDPPLIPPAPNPTATTTFGTAKIAAAPPTTAAAGTAILANLAPLRSVLCVLAPSLEGSFGASVSFFSPSLVSRAGSDQNSFTSVLLDN